MMSNFYGTLRGKGKNPVTKCGHDHITCDLQSYKMKAHCQLAGDDVLTIEIWDLLKNQRVQEVVLRLKEMRDSQSLPPLE